MRFEPQFLKHGGFDSICKRRVDRPPASVGGFFQNPLSRHPSHVQNQCPRFPIRAEGAHSPQSPGSFWVVLSSMAASPLCDGKRFAENLMQVLRAVWRAWCTNEPTDVVRVLKRYHFRGENGATCLVARRIVRTACGVVADCGQRGQNITSRCGLDLWRTGRDAHDTICQRSSE